MTVWAASLARADVEEFLVETMGLDSKTIAAYTLVMMQVRAHGFLPYEERAMANIARCTPHTWTKRIWPQIGHLFEMRDGCLYMWES